MRKTLYSFVFLTKKGFIMIIVKEKHTGQVKKIFKKRKPPSM